LRTAGETVGSTGYSGLAAAALLSVIVAELMHRHSGWTGPGVVAWVSLGGFLALEFRATAMTGRMILAAGLGLGAVLIAADSIHVRDLANALDSAAFFAVFVGVLAFLRMAAAGSPTVRACGRLLADQPHGRRYLALMLGTHLLGNLLNMSSLALLGSMIGPEAHEQERRRLLLACHRGFAAVPLWSPFALTIGLVLSLNPGLSWSRYAPLGLGLAAVLIGMGWLFDRLSRSGSVGAGIAPSTAHDTSAVPEDLVRLLALMALLAAMVFLFARMTDARLILSVLTCVPVFGLAWTTVQTCESGRVAGTIARGLHRDLPALRNEVATLAGAAFLGALAAAAIDAGQMRALMGDLGVDPAMMIALVPWMVAAGSMIGISPIVGIMVMGQVFATMPQPHPPDIAVAAALTSAWACAVSVSPFTAVVLIVARLGGSSPWTVGLRWNGMFTLAMLIVFSIIVYGLARL